MSLHVISLNRNISVHQTALPEWRWNTGSVVSLTCRYKTFWLHAPDGRPSTRYLAYLQYLWTLHQRHKFRSRGMIQVPGSNPGRALPVSLKEICHYIVSRLPAISLKSSMLKTWVQQLCQSGDEIHGLMQSLTCCYVMFWLHAASLTSAMKQMVYKKALSA